MRPGKASPVFAAQQNACRKTFMRDLYLLAGW
jgi:hypothetical protein